LPGLQARSRGKRRARTPKVYLNNSGLRAHLLRLDLEGLRAQPPTLGPLLEHFVAMELRKLCSWSTERPALHPLRTPTGQEIAVLLENRKHEPVDIETKAAATVVHSDYRHLKAFMTLTGDRMKCGVLLYTGNQVLPFDPRFWAVPVSALWS
jgi:predicted AAA+ superfamily ATPase